MNGVTLDSDKSLLAQTANGGSSNGSRSAQEKLYQNRRRRYPRWAETHAANGVQEEKKSALINWIDVGLSGGRDL